MPRQPPRPRRRQKFSLEYIFAVASACTASSLMLVNLLGSPSVPHSLEATLERYRSPQEDAANSLRSTKSRVVENIGSHTDLTKNEKEVTLLARDPDTVVVAKEIPAAVSAVDVAPHRPEYFLKQVPLEKLIERGNVLTVHTGCSIATWSYQGKRHVYRPLNDCRQHAKGAAMLRAHQVTPETASQVQLYDSIYVPIVKLEHFVNETLPHIENDFVLMSGQNSLPEGPIPRRVYDTIMSNPRVVRWFLQNLSVYAYNPRHAKLSPFPYGIHPLQPAAILSEMKANRTLPKDDFIFLSHFQKANNLNVRRHIPNGEEVEPAEYLRRMQRSQYVLSPDGDRPECHRHYEAIGLGTMPITSLDPYLYRHLQGNVVFNETRWNLTELEERLPRNPVVNRRLIFEEYWMEYIEREVGRPVRWWDPSRDVRTSLAEITDIVKNNTPPSNEVRRHELLVKNESKAMSHAADVTSSYNSTRSKQVAQAPVTSHGKNSSQVVPANASALSKGAHDPNYFSQEVPLENLIARKNVLTVYSGCAIATWSFSGTWSLDNPKDDCLRFKGLEFLRMRAVTSNTTFRVQPYDSIYVPLLDLELFIKLVLPKIQCDFVLISGQKSYVPFIPREQYDILIEHPRIVLWFLQNLSVYAYNPYHPKLRPFPYGIVDEYPDTGKFLKELKTNYTQPKDNFIFVSFVTKRNNVDARKDLPRPPEKLKLPEYLRLMHQSQYVLSPDGDRPECHRHYEAIGLGTVPITSLDPYLYRHLQGNAIFNEHTWNMTELEERLPRNPVVNRRLIFEEYWMEYIEKEVGHPMRWWNKQRGVRSSLAEITEIVKNIVPS